MRRAVLGLASGLALSACDGGGDEGEPFVGTWRATAGEVRKACPGQSPYTEALTNDLVWIRGADSDLASASSLTACRLRTNISRMTASLVPGHKCTHSDGADGTVTGTFTDYTFGLSFDGRTALENASGLITHVKEGKETICSFDAAGRYQRVDEATPGDPVR